jgi:tetratricopeptide (TPR) repeat protein
MSGADPHQSPVSRPIALSDVIASHIEKIQRSGVFSTSDSLRRLLRFVVHETMAGRGDEVKEYNLGVSVLGRGDSFDPKADPIVRVQMRRLREHLARYYAGEGQRDPLIIDIPKGRYVAVFRSASANGTASVVTEAATLTVGHETEMTALRSAFESATAGEGRMFCLFGEPGIGKTTAVEVFLRELETSGVRCTIGRGRCSERLAGSEAYLPVLEALETVLQGGEPLHRLMRDVAPSWYLQLASSTEDPRVQPVPAENRVASQERLKRDLVAFLKALAREHPVLLFFDDLHWADASTVDALAYVAPRCRSQRILIVGTYRPAELLATNQAFLRVKLELQGHDVWREMPMQLLTRLDVDRYLALQFPDHRFPPELAARLHRRTEGNPLFVADLVRFLRDRGVLAQRNDHWVMAGDLKEVEHDLPESVRSMVQRKIAELDDPDRKLLSAAAVLGQQFDSAVVARALAMDAIEAEERLEALDRARGFVRVIGECELPDGTLSLEYAFVHILYQNALHGALTPTRKASLSLTVAEAVLALYGPRSAEVAAQLALLFEAGRDFARASDFFLLASQNAARMHAGEQAIALARQSAALAERLEGRERWSRVMAAALQSATQHQLLTRPAEAVADFVLAERAARELADPVAEVSAILGQALICFLTKRMPEMKALGIRAMQLAERSGSAGSVAACDVILAMERSCAGDVATAERQFDRAIPVLRQSGLVRHALTGVLFRGLLHTWRLEHQQAEDALEWAHRQAGDLHLGFESIISLWHRARARGNQGQVSDAWDLLEDALRLAELLGDRFWLPRIANTRGWLLAELFDTEGALRLNTEAVGVARECGDVEAECNSHINAAHDYLTLGEPQRAWDHLQQAEARYHDDVWFRWVYFPRLQAEMASYWLAQGDLPKARTCAGVSLAAAQRTSSRKRIAWAHKLQGEIAMLEDRPDEARREFRSALAVLEHHACPTIEWQILRAASGPAGALEGDPARRELLAHAGAVAQVLADSIRDAKLRRTFLNGSMR